MVKVILKFGPGHRVVDDDVVMLVEQVTDFAGGLWKPTFFIEKVRLNAISLVYQGCR